MDNITFMKQGRAHTFSAKKTLPPPLQELGFDWDRVTAQYESAAFRSLPDALRRTWMENRDLSGFSVFSCGYYQRAEGHRWERDRSKEGIVLYCVEGKGTVTIEKTVFPVMEGDVVYCAPGTRHGYAADSQTPWSIYWMHVSGERLYRPCGFHRLFAKNPVQHIGLLPELIFFFRSLIRNFESTDNTPKWLLSSLCAQHILAHIATAPKLAPGTIPHVNMLNAMIHHIHEQAETRVSLDELIRNTGFSKTHACKLFKSFTGTSPIAYLNKIKMEKACALLTTTDLQISQIAYRLGFDDPYYFSRLFAQATGHPPRTFRNIHLSDSRSTYTP